MTADSDTAVTEQNPSLLLAAGSMLSTTQDQHEFLSALERLVNAVFGE